MHAVRYGSCSSADSGTDFDGSGIAAASSALSFLSTSGTVKRWYVITDSAQAVVRVPAMTVTWPSCQSLVAVFSSGGSLLFKISWKIVSCETFKWPSYVAV